MTIAQDLIMRIITEKSFRDWVANLPPLNPPLTGIQCAVIEDGCWLESNEADLGRSYIEEVELDWEECDTEAQSIFIQFLVSVKHNETTIPVWIRMIATQGDRATESQYCATVEEMLTLDNSLEVHEDWLCEIRRRIKFNYENPERFSSDNNLKYMEVFWFVRGNPVREQAFKEICGILDFDWERIQNPYES